MQRTFNFAKLDIENQESLKALFKNQGPFDAVLNLAARAGVRCSIENPHVYLSTNAEGTLNLWNACVITDAKSLSSHPHLPSMLGKRYRLPKTLRSMNPYPLMPLQKRLENSWLTAIINCIILMFRWFDISPYLVPQEDQICLLRFIKWIAEEETIQMFGDGSQSRDFTYVDDIALGTIAAIQDVGYEIINLGGGRNPVSLNTIISKLEELLGNKAKIDHKPFHIADLMETWADIEKAKNLLGWEPKVSLDEGLEKSVSWYMKNRKWLKEVKV